MLSLAFYAQRKNNLSEAENRKGHEHSSQCLVKVFVGNF